MSQEHSDPTPSGAASTPVNAAQNGESLVPEATPESTIEVVLDCYECSACGYAYQPTKGDARGNIEPGTPFPDLPAKWKCPVCDAPKTRFNNVGRAGAASGFKENLKYGLGVNTMTPGQKNLLIFGSLLLAVIFFLSLYSLE
jgi:rubredoxin